jgi:hypothetical protein
MGRSGRLEQPDGDERGETDRTEDDQDQQKGHGCGLPCPTRPDASCAPCVLGTLTGRLARPLVAGEPLVVVGRHLATDGRKRSAAAALFDEDGNAVAWSESIWIELGR